MRIPPQKVIYIDYSLSDPVLSDTELLIDRKNFGLLLQKMALRRPLLNLAAAQSLEDAELDAEQLDRHFLPRGDPFELPDHQFVKLYRLTKDLVDNIIDRVRKFHPQRRMAPIDVSTKVSTQKHNV